MNHNNENLADYNEAHKYGPSEHNPPKIQFQSEYIFDQEGTTGSLPDDKLSDVDSLKYFFDKYISSVERGKPNQKMANQLKTIIDIVQVKN